MTIKVKENKIILGNKEKAIEKKLVKKLERIVRGVTQENPKEDALLINEGKEGKGKTNSSLVESAYLRARTGRDIYLFFRIKSLMDFASKNEKKIIIWDEPSLDSLSRDQLNTLNLDMQRLFMTIRKKRHIFIINYTKFWKFPEYMVVDRANGMLHMIERNIGRFFYIRKKRLEQLWNDYRTKKKRTYKKNSEFGGSMPIIMEKHFKELEITINGIKNTTYEDYEEQKDLAILSIGEEKKTKRQLQLENKIELWELRFVKLLKFVLSRTNLTKTQLGSAIDFNIRRINELETKISSKEGGVPLTTTL